MDFSKLNTTILRQVLKLSERKETLLKELKHIEEEIVAHLHQKTTSQTSAKKAGSTKKASAPKSSKRLKKGVMRENILKALTEAGPSGLKVTDLAKKIEATSSSIHVWFSTVGKKLAEIEKVAAGHFRIR